ncbi:hypothetical protein K493DRAFT_314343 [Basidiobolus meristosporus CBS 931.73]|uniref:LYC1 C-terminal domain-containing protein n=1 Tax=Basidiobolus meristosporus CBS 931.73 TaxID=1314790 RepID=A0A1Y1YFL7_9FUNG|nr:hypothetical protein K493DRAFT_314343 [Basidiobolus meristosporus CBS 931.73]|eukprot:ORX96775.1 hypothetical protein K493DRAFT_314343 [Basidiobolus meristosporus CBS 931.73]
MTQDTEELVLVKATHDQVLTTWHNTHVEWGVKLDLEQYLKREKLLANQEFTSENITVWALVSKDDPSNSQPLAHCETFRRPVVIKSSGKVGDIQERDCYSIATVFCPAHNRGKGYASKMMKLLYQELKETGAAVSNLYSDVGPTFYARLGWKIYPALEGQLTAKNTPKGSQLPGQVSWLTANSIDEIAEEDCDLLREELKNSTTAAVVVLPRRIDYDWHWARSRFYAGVYDRPVPDNLGARIQSKEASEFVVWTHDFRDNQLLVLRLRSTSKEATRLLLEAAKIEASNMGISQVVVWNLPAEHTPEGVTIVERDSSLPSMAFFEFPDEEYEWLGNEKYAWV